MTAAEIVAELEPLGLPSYKKGVLNHGVREPVFGVKIEELKKIQKRVKKDHALSLALFDTGIYDAQYLAGLIADETRIGPGELRHWMTTANSRPIRASTVATVAADSTHGAELAREWIDAPEEEVAHAGWTTFSLVVAVRPDSELDVGELRALLQRVEQTIHQSPNWTRYGMNGFVISLGCYVRELTDAALQAGERIGRVRVDVGRTECRVPPIPEYIRKVEQRGSVGKKRKTARC